MCCIVYDLQILLRMCYRTRVCRYVSFVVIYCNVICTLLCTLLWSYASFQKSCWLAQFGRTTRNHTITMPQCTEILNASGCIFWKLWLPSFTHKLYGKTNKKRYEFGQKAKKNPMKKGSELAQNPGHIWTQHAVKPLQQFFVRSHWRIWIFLNFGVLILS